MLNSLGKQILKEQMLSFIRTNTTGYNTSLRLVCKSLSDLSCFKFQLLVWMSVETQEKSSPTILSTPTQFNSDAIYLPLGSHFLWFTFHLSYGASTYLPVQVQWFALDSHQKGQLENYEHGESDLVSEEMNSRVSWSPLRVCPVQRTTYSLPTQTLRIWLHRAQRDLWSKASAENHILMRSPSAPSRSPFVSQQMRYSGPSSPVRAGAEYQNTAVPELAVAGVSGPDRNWGMSWLSWSRAWGKEACWLCLLVCVVQTHMCHLGEVVLALAELHRER